MFQDNLKWKWDKEVSFSFVELGLEFNPVKAESVEESWQSFHKTENTNSEACPKSKDGKQDQTSIPW